MAYGFKIEYLQNAEPKSPEKRCEIEVLKDLENDEVCVLDVIFASYNLLMMASHTAYQANQLEAYDRINESMSELERLQWYFEKNHKCKQEIRYKTIS